MAHRTVAQLRRRQRIESLIGLVAPALDALLFVGERISKAVDRSELPPADRSGRRTPIGGGDRRSA